MAQKISNNGLKPSHDEIARRAREIYERSGRIPGRDLENWLEAESQLLSTRKTEQEQRTPGVEPRSSGRVVAKPDTRA